MEASRNPAVAEVLAAWRTRLVGVVDGILTARPPRSTALAAGRGAGRVLRRAADRRAAEARSANAGPFLSGSLSLILHALTGPE